VAANKRMIGMPRHTNLYTNHCYAGNCPLT